MKIKSHLASKGLIRLHRMWTLIHFFIIISFVFPNENQFAFTGSNGTHSTISLQSSTAVEEIVSGYSRIAKEGYGHTTELGLVPESP